MTRDRGVATEWLARFEGAGLDGVIAKPEDGLYEPGKRAMIKVKHARTADCVVAGFRWHKTGKDVLVGSLLLGLYDDKGALHHVGVTSAFTMAVRKQLAIELAPLREQARDAHPWREWADAAGGEGTRMPGGQSRWSAGKDLSWEPVRIERVCEVKYDHMQGARFRHAAIFLRWRPDKPPARLPVRSARGHDGVRAGEGVRGGVARQRAPGHVGRRLLSRWPWSAGAAVGSRICSRGGRHVQSHHRCRRPVADASGRPAPPRRRTTSTPLRAPPRSGR